MDSEAGKGSAFTIYLPEAGEESDPAIPEAGRPVQGGTETILLVEDEPTLLKMAARVLQECGYTVRSTTLPSDALAMDVGGVNLLVTDVVLPEMNGMELSTKMKERFPELRVLYMSGYADEALFRDRILASRAPFLQKPFSRDELARKVREALDRVSE